jgi:hypothetical protein
LPRAPVPVHQEVGHEVQHHQNPRDDQDPEYDPEERRLFGRIRHIHVWQSPVRIEGLPDAALGIAPHSLRAVTPKSLEAVLAAHGGSVNWNGAPIDQRVRQRFGYMPEERGLYPKMKIGEQIV